MSELEERLAEILRKPVRSSADAEAVARAAEALADILQARERAERALAPSEARAPQTNGAGNLSGLTLHDAAERVLEQAGIPLHVKELGKRIKGGGWTHPRSRKARPEQIQFQLAARLPRYPDRFQRMAPNTFGLVGWSEKVLERPRPMLGLFRGPPGGIGRESGERFDEPARTPWRS